MPMDPSDWSLRSREPGQSAVEKVRELRAAGAAESEVRAWELGAQGERIVGQLFARLGPEWTVLHDVPVGGLGANIDHVLVGPKGVFTVNTKHHPRANVRVTGDAVLVRERECDYAAKARFEGRRAARLLTDATGGWVSVQPLVVFVGADRVTVDRHPQGVLVTDGDAVVELLESFTLTHTPQTVRGIVMAAVQPDTWAAEETSVREGRAGRASGRGRPEMAGRQVFRSPEYQARQHRPDRGIWPFVTVALLLVFVMFMALASLVTVYGEPLAP